MVLYFFFFGGTTTATAGADVRFNSICCAMLTTLLVNQYSTSPAEAGQNMKPNTSGISSIIVDKNWKHVTQISNRNVILVKGEVVFDGDTPSLLADPELLQKHLGV